MSTDFITIKTTPDSLTKLRMIAAMSGEKQYSILDRVLTEELQKVSKKSLLGGHILKPLTSAKHKPVIFKMLEFFWPGIDLDNYCLKTMRIQLSGTYYLDVRGAGEFSYRFNFDPTTGDILNNVRYKDNDFQVHPGHDQLEFVKFVNGLGYAFY